MTESRTLPPEALDAWSAVLREHFDLPADAVPVGLVLDLARDVAIGVARPAAPLSAFVAGLVADHPALGSILSQCAVLVDGARVDDGAELADAETVDVLPPFAGG